MEQERSRLPLPLALPPLVPLPNVCRRLPARSDSNVSRDSEVSHPRTEAERPPHLKGEARS